MPTSSSIQHKSNKGNKSSINQATVLFSPLVQPTTNSGVYSKNLSRQRTFISYYNTLGVQDKEKVRQSYINQKKESHLQLQYQNQLGVASRNQHLFFQQPPQPPHQQPQQQNFINKLVRINSNSDLFDSNSLSDLDEKSLIDIKDSYNRNIAALGESLDLFNITSSAANKFLESNKGFTYDRQLLKAADPSKKSCPPKSSSSSTKQLMILKLKKNRRQSSFSDDIENRFDESTTNKKICQQQHRFGSGSTKSHETRFAVSDFQIL